MPGFRSVDIYIKKYGEIEGKQKFEKCIIRRNGRTRMKQANTSTQKFVYTVEDVISGGAIVCEECSKMYARIDKKHLQKTCSGKLQSVTEYKTKYPNCPIICNKLRSSNGVTKDKLIKLWGEVEGSSKWEQYRHRQAKSNTFEYKKQKYGWNKDTFDSYNADRATTLQNCIERHGKIEGLAFWCDYIDRQKFTCSLDYFIQQYGIDEGTSKFYNWRKKWAHSDGKNVSKKETLLVEEIQKHFPNIQRAISISRDRKYNFDCGIGKKLVDFQGTFWHMDPRVYTADNFNAKTGKTAKEHWDKDREKYLLAKSLGYDVYYIWEQDWDAKPNKIVEDVVKWLKK